MQSTSELNSSATTVNPNLTFSYKDILVKKLARAVGSSVLSQLVILLIYIFVANINVFHPLEWMTSTLNTFTYVSTWLFVIIFSGIIFAQCIICAKDYVFMTSYSSTRFQQLIRIFSIHNFIVLSLHVIIGGALIWLILSLVEGQNQDLIMFCEPNQYCLNQENFFLVMGGFWIGLYYFLRVHITSKHLVFPVIQQRKFLQLRSNLSVLLRESLTSSLWPTIYFAVFYYLWGNQLESHFMKILHLGPLPRKSSILIYLYSLWFSALYFFSMNIMRFFFYLFLTEAVTFPLVKENVYVLTLQNAIVIDNLPIIQNLACLDLFLLSQWSPVRRQVFFSLSQPGGHPHNWNALIESVLKLFTEYSELLKKSTESTLVQEKLRKPNDPIMPFSPIRLQSPEASLRYRNLRNMSCINENVEVVDIAQSLPQQKYLETLKKSLDDRIVKTVALLKTLFGINFLFGELPEVNIQRCLGNGYLIIWASQGIAELACASLKEDKYGVVQKDMPTLITVLVELKQDLDKLNKVPALSRKVAALDDFNYKMKNAVSAAVKRSLFNICLHFGDYFDDFGLNQDVKQYLQLHVLAKNL